MHIRRFQGTAMREVLREIRAELGPDALVVSTRTVHRDRRWFGKLSQPVIEVTAAVDRERRKNTPEATKPSERTAPDPSWNELRLTRALISPLEREFKSLRESVEQLAARDTRPNEPQLVREVQNLRRMMADVLASHADHTPDPNADPYTSAGLDPRHAAMLAATLRESDIDRKSVV